jgi:hypothetical protein
MPGTAKWRRLMRLRLSTVILGLSLILLMPAVSRADDIYTFNANFPAGSPDGLSTFSWSFDVPSLLTTTMTITSLSSESVTGVLSDFGVCTISSAEITDPSTEFDVQTNFTGLGCIPHITFMAATPTITHLGMYGSINPLTVSNSLTISPTTSTPEPSALILVGLGLVALVGAAKFRVITTPRRSGASHAP